MGLGFFATMVLVAQLIQLYSEQWRMERARVLPLRGRRISCRPYAGLVSDGAGNFYGTTPQLPGGIYDLSQGNGGTFFTFSQSTDALGGLILDSAGDLYGTTASGGSGQGGTVFKYVLPPRP